MADSKTIDNKVDASPASSEMEIIQTFLANFQKIQIGARHGRAIAKLIADTVDCTHVMILAHDKENATLSFSSFHPENTATPPEIFINTFNTEANTTLAQLTAGDIVIYDSPPEDERLKSLTTAIEENHVMLLPLQSNDSLVAVLALYNQPDAALSDESQQTLEILRPVLSGILEMVFQQETLAKRITDVEREAEIFSRIDEELNDTIELNYVFTMMKDWALRFTNADAAALALYDRESEALRIMSQYGFKPDAFVIDEELPPGQGGIMLRVARKGIPEIVPNVLADSDYFALADGMKAQMSVPIEREEKVIGVLTLLSREINGFTDDHLDFAKRLSNRAGVAVDNARLFGATKREREKLSNILRNIADNVILVGLDHRIELINSSTILAFHLSADDTYVGKNFTDVITHSKLQIAYQDAVENEDTVVSELELPNGRTYHASIEYLQGIGRIIVMQDITYFKETDRLKTELVATVSHDLKQPLSVMRGYLDLLKMVNDFDEKSEKYMDNLNFAFYNMRQLIDDLLDIARIEAGLSLEFEDVSLIDILNRSIRSSTQQATLKQITMDIDLPENLPIISGDPKRLEQIFNNLIGNAVKYTPPEGEVKVYTEVRQNALRIFVKDNGMGIGAEDQAKIFERFYRVRRPETDSIEGTGLGLAIVKSLIEAHEGKIDLKSVLGGGSTFRVTLPI